MEELNSSKKEDLKDHVLVINKRNSLIEGEENENEGNSNSIENVK